MRYILPLNFSDASTALLRWFYEAGYAEQAIVVYVNTGWADGAWLARIKAAHEYAHALGFQTHWIDAPADWATLCESRKAFPSKKYQWCVALLKIAPLLSWLDTVDPALEGCIVLPKRQSLQRTPLMERLEEVESWGERSVWHPLCHVSDKTAEQLAKLTPLPVVGNRAFECAPCIMDGQKDKQAYTDETIGRAESIEAKIEQPIFVKPIQQEVAMAKSKDSHSGDRYARDDFSNGCGDPVGCGL